ncbi:MAG: ATP-binding protein [Alphaproteobacteria bacterium]|jgi:hypothetical protein
MALSPSTENFEVSLASTFASRPPPEWLVEGLIPAKAITLLMGQSQAKKSFIAIDLAACIASGREFLGRKTKPGAVLYLAIEDSFDLGLRFKAVMENFDDASSQRLLVSESSVTLPGNTVAFGDLRKFLRAHSEGANPIRTIVIDTYVYFHDGDINSPSDTSTILRELRSLIQQFKLSIIVVCHPARDNDKRPMGAMNLFNSVACILGVKSDEGSYYSVITVLKNKGSPIGQKTRVDFTLVGFGDGTSTMKVHSFRPIAAGPMPSTTQTSSTQISSDDEQMLGLLEASQGGGLTHSQWSKDASAKHSITPSVFNKRLKKLKDHPRLVRSGSRYHLVPVPSQCGSSAVAPMDVSSAGSGGGSKDPHPALNPAPETGEPICVEID